ncbi:MAG: DUF1273 family protein [Clostridia bacterium]|nr:DUF1273 family protein [Clostridia bacterium]
MKIINQDKVCFFGHRKIDETEELKNKLFDTIENLIINEKVDTFLFGSKSEFNTLCLKIVDKLKQKYPYIKRIYVRSTYQHIDESYKNYLLEYYEHTYFPERLENVGKATYIERNKEMIDHSRFCVVYYNQNYLPPKRKNSKRDLFEYQPKSGTQRAYNYATKKIIFNIFSNKKAFTLRKGF